MQRLLLVSMWATLVGCGIQPSTSAATGGTRVVFAGEPVSLELNGTWSDNGSGDFQFELFATAATVAVPLLKGPATVTRGNTCTMTIPVPRTTSSQNYLLRVLKSDHGRKTATVVVEETIIAQPRSLPALLSALAERGIQFAHAGRAPGLEAAGSTVAINDEIPGGSDPLILWVEDPEFVSIESGGHPFALTVLFALDAGSPCRPPQFVGDTWILLCPMDWPARLARDPGVDGEFAAALRTAARNAFPERFSSQ